MAKYYENVNLADVESLKPLKVIFGLQTSNSLHPSKKLKLLENTLPKA